MVKLASKEDIHSILKLAPDARKMKVTITRHLPMAMQAQRKTLIQTASRLYNQGKKIHWNVFGSEYCLCADNERVVP